ncbi:MAG: hypothetical protein JWN70_3144 [Planctomycetaceae bacterium]|nr:hypothetical protein [Planctomycetaceae bacterium]
MKSLPKQSLGLICLTLVLWTAAGRLSAQDGTTSTEPLETPATQPTDAKSADKKPPTPAEVKAEIERKRVIKADHELRARLDDTVWNDLDLNYGQPGQVWMFRPLARRGTKNVREWYLNDDVGLPLVGTWEVKQEQIVLYALDGKLIGRGKYDEDEIVGSFIDADHHREFGKFRLREETKRNYRVLPMRVRTRTLGK